MHFFVHRVRHTDQRSQTQQWAFTVLSVLGVCVHDPVIDRVRVMVRSGFGIGSLIIEKTKLNCWVLWCWLPLQLCVPQSKYEHFDYETLRLLGSSPTSRTLCLLDTSTMVIVRTAIQLLLGPDRRSNFLVRETSTRSLVQKACTCVIISRTSFFSYEKLGWIRTLLYSVRETWSHVIEMLRHYWLEVRFVFVYNILLAQGAFDWDIQRPTTNWRPMERVRVAHGSAGGGWKVPGSKAPVRSGCIWYDNAYQRLP